MKSPIRSSAQAVMMLALPLLLLTPSLATAEEQLPWSSRNTQGAGSQQDYGGYEPEPYQPQPQPQPNYGQGSGTGSSGQSNGSYGSSYYGDEPAGQGGYQPDPYGQAAQLPRPTRPSSGYGTGQDYGNGQAYQPVPAYAPSAPPAYEQPQAGFSVEEINGAGHRFFGKISGGVANVIEHAFQSQGQPNGYILGEEGGGAFIAGLRYGEGVLHTRDAGTHKVYWQGPSIGYDFGAEGSKTMILVYNLRQPTDIYQTFGGVGGQAYIVGGVGINYLAAGDLVLAPIRSGLGLRLGANVGYLKYTQSPTWNPF